MIEISEELKRPFDSADDMVMSNIIALAALYQSGKVQEWSEIAGIAGEGSKHAHLLPSCPHVYSLCDQFGRQIQGDIPSEAAGNLLIEQMEKKHNVKLKGKWRIVPVVVQRANTVFSQLWDTTGAEHELAAIHGMSGQEIMKNPDAVSAYRKMLHMQAKSGGNNIEEYSGSGDDD